MLFEDLEIDSNLFICAGLYQANDYKAVVNLRNILEENQTFSLDYPFEIRLNNFECSLAEDELNFTQVQPGRYKKLIDQLRLDHLNSEEKEKLIALIHENQEVFHLDDEPEISLRRSATNAVKHKIATKDEIPVYQRS